MEFLDFFHNTRFLTFWILLGIMVFIMSSFVIAPYGRHNRKGWGPRISNKLGWFLMELPALITVPFLFHLCSQREFLHIVLVGLWIFHYGHRTLVYPFMTRTTGKTIPISVVLMAIVFNVINGIIVGSVFTQSAHNHTGLLVLGSLIFFIGAWINIRSDYRLINLRSTTSEGYTIPNGFMFEFVSCPNHLGEIVEWFGFALVAWHIGPMTFAIWTAANLIPRSIAHHNWYKQEFPDYPSNRHAVFPGLL